jgi:thiamine biosynthesis protein ThiS
MTGTAARTTRDAGAARGAADAVALTIALTVNGERRDVPRGWTVADLLRAHELDPRMVVVERNRVILRDRDAYPALGLRDGDVLEIVHFVGGG